MSFGSGVSSNIYHSRVVILRTCELYISFHVYYIYIIASEANEGSL